MLWSGAAFAKAPGRYEVQADATAGVLSVKASFDRAVPGGFKLYKGSRKFVDGIKDWAGLCQKGPCSFSYEFRLADAAKALDDVALVGKVGDVYLTTPSAWLVLPEDAEKEGSVELTVRTKAPMAFASGLPITPDGKYEVGSGYFDDLSPSLFGRVRLHELRVGGARIDVVMAERFRLDDAAVVRWIRRGADAVSAYFGRFPVDHLLVYVRTRGNDARGGGMTLGYGGAAIFIPLALDALPKALEDDWVVPHEMVHLAMPNVPWRHHWIEEGLATYVEPLARIRSKELSPGPVWAEMMAGMEQGLPAKGDQGLDHTNTWGRTYWGGALFFLTADVRIRTESKGKLGLEDALKGILAAGGSIRKQWPIREVLRVADEAVGMKVLGPLYDEVKDNPVREDLPALWRRLGVRRDGAVAEFNAEAELAHVVSGISYGGVRAPK